MREKLLHLFSKSNNHGWYKRVWAEPEDGNASFAADQYMDQIEGFKASLDFLEHVFITQGPFDGGMGFSQVMSNQFEPGPMVVKWFVALSIGWCS